MKNTLSYYTWLLDAGHGGMKDGKYTTAPGKMHVFDDGLTFYEGVNNRAIVDRLAFMMRSAEIDHVSIHDPELDTPLVERVARANKLVANNKRCIYLSVHSDAMPDGAHGKGSGYAVYTSIGKTKSDAIAEIFCDVIAKNAHPFKLRTDFWDGDADKEENFYVLRETKCPAILVENLFFDNRREAEYLLSEGGRDRIAMNLLEAMVEIENKKPI